MAISYLKNAVNNNVVVHSDATGSIVLTGNDSVSNIASPGETVIGSTIKQVWFGSISGASGYWLISEAGDNLYFTLTGAAGYIMFDIKKVTGP